MAIIPTRSVINDSGESLKMLLSNNISDLADTDVGFESPAEFTPSTTAKSLSIFFFQGKQNEYMRNNRRKPAELAGGGGSMSELREPPVILDLTFMLTPYGTSTAAATELYEQIVGVLYDIPVLKEDMLEGNLLEQGNEEIRITPVELGIEMVHNIWSIFPDKPYKVSLFYTLSPVKIMSGRITEETRVSTKNLEFYKIK